MKLARFKRGAALCLAASMLATAAACSATSSSESISSAVTGESADSSGEVKIIFALGEDLPAMDQAITRNVTSDCILPLIFDQPIYYNWDGTFSPGIFEDWSANEDCTAWTVTIRDGVQFHDGHVLTAEDVQYSAEIWITDEDIMPYNNRVYQFLTDCEIVDERTITYYFSQSVADFVYNMSLPYTPIMVEKELYEELGREAYLEEPIGCGPFKFVQWQPGADLELARFDDWYGAADGELTNVDTFIFRYVSEATTRVSALQTGEIDIIRDVPAEQKEQVAALDGITLYTGSSVTLGLCTFTCDTDRIFNDENARRAVYYAIDRESICEYILGGGTPWYVNAPEGVQGYNASVAEEAAKNTYDPELAKSYLEQSSYNGETVKIIIPSGKLPRNDEVIQSMVQMLEEVGFVCELNIIDQSTWDTTRRAGDYDISVFSNSFSPGTATWYTSHLVNELDSCHFPDKELANLVANAAAAGSEEEQTAYLEDAVALMAEEYGPLCPFFTIENSAAWKENITNFTLYPNQTFDFRRIQVNS